MSEHETEHINKRVVLVTGCSSGIGRALIDAFKARGLRVFASARRRESIDALQEAGFETVQLDITDPVSIKNAVNKIVNEAGCIDYLVNNAGHSVFGPLAEMPLDAVRKVLETNLVSQLAVCQAVVPEMAKRGSGCIVNIGSVVGFVTTPFVGAYSASKSGLHILSEALRMEVAPFGIKVVVVQPGAVRSEVGATGTQHSELSRYEEPDSLYYPVREQIKKRAMASQDKPTPAEDFAKQLVAKVLQADPPKTIRLGRGVGFLKIVSLLPASWRDKIFSQHFKLDLLGR